MKPIFLSMTTVADMVLILDYLIQKQYSVSTYNGYDLSEEMLTQSKDRLKGFEGDLNQLIQAG